MSIFDECTHYSHDETKSSLDGRRWYYVFTVGECEQCGQLVEEPNGLHVTGITEASLKAKGLEKWTGLLPPEVDVNVHGDCHCGCLNYDDERDPMFNTYDD